MTRNVLLVGVPVALERPHSWVATLNCMLPDVRQLRDNKSSPAIRQHNATSERR